MVEVVKPPNSENAVAQSHHHLVDFAEVQSKKEVPDGFKHRALIFPNPYLDSVLQAVENAILIEWFDKDHRDPRNAQHLVKRNWGAGKVMVRFFAENKIEGRV
jgi:hypothetical protein